MRPNFGQAFDCKHDSLWDRFPLGIMFVYMSLGTPLINVGKLKFVALT